jgi:hypothetical protein
MCLCDYLYRRITDALLGVSAMINVIDSRTSPSAGNRPRRIGLLCNEGSWNGGTGGDRILKEMGGWRVSGFMREVVSQVVGIVQVFHPSFPCSLLSRPPSIRTLVVTLSSLHVLV